MTYAYGFSYAHGPHNVMHGKPASAFSKGDPLMFTSASSLSIVDEPNGSAQIVGVALSSSTESYKDLVPYLVAHPDTVFWSVATGGSNFTEGWKLEIGWNSSSSIWETVASDTTPRVVIIRGEQWSDLSQLQYESGTSFVKVKFLSDHSGVASPGVGLGG